MNGNGSACLFEPNPKLFLHSYERGCGWVGWGGQKIAYHDKAQIKHNKQNTFELGFYMSKFEQYLFYIQIFVI